MLRPENMRSLQEAHGCLVFLALVAIWFQAPHFMETFGKTVGVVLQKLSERLRLPTDKVPEGIFLKAASCKYMQPMLYEEEICIARISRRTT